MFLFSYFVMSIELLSALHQIDAYTIWQVQVSDFSPMSEASDSCEPSLHTLISAESTYLLIVLLVMNLTRKKYTSRFSLKYYVLLLELTLGSLLKYLNLHGNQKLYGLLTSWEPKIYINH